MLRMRFIWSISEVYFDGMSCALKMFLFLHWAKKYNYFRCKPLYFISWIPLLCQKSKGFILFNREWKRGSGSFSFLLLSEEMISWGLMWAVEIKSVAFLIKETKINHWLWKQLPLMSSHVKYFKQWKCFSQQCLSLRFKGNVGEKKK